MPDPHVRRRTLHRLLVDGFVDRAELAPVLRHLTDCPSCREELDLLEQRAASRWEGGPESPACDLERRVDGYFENLLDKSGVFDRVQDTVLDHHLRFEREKRQAPELLRELLASAPQDLSALEARFRSRSVCELLLQKGAEEWFENPDQARQHLELAIALADLLDPELYGSEALFDLRARAWALLGNVHRLQCDLRAADRTFEQAEELLGRGTGDPMARASVYDLMTSLRRDQRRFPEAQNLLSVVVKTYRQAGELHLAGRALLNLATLYDAMSQAEKAIPVLRQALDWIDVGQEPRLELIARHNLITCLSDSGRHAEALAMLQESSPVYDQFPDPWTRSRRHWLEGKIAYGLGDFEAGEGSFLAARDAYVDQRSSYPAALVSLDLAALYADQKRTADLKALAEEMYVTFQSLEIHREAFAALIMFQQAARAEQVTLTLVRKIAAAVKEASQLPSPSSPAE